MKHQRHKLVYIFMCLLFWIAGGMLNPSRVVSADVLYLSRHHSNLGKEFLDEGKISPAVKHLMQSLMIDFRNKDAKATLQKLSERSLDGNLKFSSLELLRFVELVDYLDFLYSRISSLERNNRMHLEFILKNGLNDADILKEAQFLQKKIEHQQPLARVFAEGIDFDSLKLNRLMSALESHKDQYLQELNEAESLNNQLRDLKKTVVSFLFESKRIGDTAAMDQTIHGIQKELVEKESTIRSQKKELNFFRSELKRFQDDFAGMQDKFEKTNQKIVDLTRELAGMTLDLYEKDNALGSKKDRLKTLEDQLKDTKERLNLVQHIIQQKDGRIQELEKEIMKIQEKASQGTLGQNQITSLSSDLTSLNGQMIEQSQSRDKQIRLLEQQIENLDQRYELLEANLMKKDLEIQLLNESLAKRDKLLKNYKAVFHSKDRKLFEYDGIVQIYRGKLDETRQNLRTKEEKLEEMQALLDKLYRRMDDDQTMNEPQPISLQEGPHLQDSINIDSSDSDRELIFQGIQNLLRNSSINPMQRISPNVY